MKLKLLLLALVMGLMSCENDRPTVINVETFLIKVDNIVVSEVNETTLPIFVDFYGVIGTNGCHQSSHFETEVDGKDILIKCFGVRQVGSDLACTGNIVELNGERLRLDIGKAGQYFIKVIQPDLSVYEQELVVN